jgi:hypothetical protein
MQIPLLRGKKIRFRRLFCENPTPKHPLIQVFARLIPYTDGENNSGINSGKNSGITAELIRITGELPEQGISCEIPSARPDASNGLYSIG